MPNQKLLRKVRSMPLPVPPPEYAVGGTLRLLGKSCPVERGHGKPVYADGVFYVHPVHARQEMFLKLYRQLTMKDFSGIVHFEFETYTLYVTPYSVGMFAACAIVLTVVFSFVFAYKTTQVQIVDYLKAE